MGGSDNPVTNVTKKVGGAAHKAANNSLPGKILNASGGGQIGAAGTLLEGGNPLANTPVGDLMTKLGISGGTPSGGGGGGTDSTDEVQSIIDKFMPKYKSSLNDKGQIQDIYKINPGAAVKAGVLNPGSVTAGKVKAGSLDINSLTPDAAALNAIKSKAMGEGPSAWAKMAGGEADLRQLAAQDAAAQQALSGAATARSGLAMRGGLGGGAAERIGVGASRDMNAARQAAMRAGSLDKLNIGMTDEANKNNMLMAIPGMDLARSGHLADLNKFNINTDVDTQKFNVGSDLDASKFNTGLKFDADKLNVANELAANTFNSGQTFAANGANASNALAGLGGENNFNMDKFKTQMAGWGSAKSGDAMAKGGKK